VRRWWAGTQIVDTVEAPYIGMEHQVVAPPAPGRLLPAEETADLEQAGSAMRSREIHKCGERDHGEQGPGPHGTSLRV